MAGVCSLSDDDIPRSVLKSARDADVPLELLGAANGLQELDNELVERCMVTPAFFGEKIFPFMAKCTLHAGKESSWKPADTKKQPVGINRRAVLDFNGQNFFADLFLERFNFEKGETRGCGAASPRQK